MNKFLFIVSTFVILPWQCFSGTDYLISSNKDCLAIDRPWPDGNSVYFCGHTNNSSCAGVKHGNKKHEIMHAGSTNFNGAKYWCCNGNESSLGTFKQGTNWTQSETITENLPNGGTCTWTRTKTICDSEWKGTKCTRAECPNAGEVFRNGECVKPCTAPNVWAAADSNNCIECPETRWQGIGTDENYDRICVHCNTETELYNNAKGKCFNKSNMQIYTKMDMNKCWKCKGQEKFKKCIKGEITEKDCPITSETNN